MKIVRTLINLFFLAGAVLLLILTVLSGSSSHFPLNKFYWLSADTSDIKGAPNRSAWTFWGVCEKNNYKQCSLGPAYPISPVDNFDTSDHVPKKFVSDRDTFYYLTRFSFSFLIVSLAFSAFALIVDLLGFCFTVVDRVVVGLVSVALFFLAGVAAFQTAAVVMARDAFKDSNLSAKVGIKAMAILWAAVVCLLIVWFNTLFSTIVHSYRKHINRVRGSPYDKETQQGSELAGDESSFTRAPPPVEEEKEDNGGIRFFKIKRNHKTSDDESV